MGKFKIYVDLESLGKETEETKSLNKKFKTKGFKVKGKVEKTDEGMKVGFKKGYDKDPN